MRRYETAFQKQLPRLTAQTVPQIRPTDGALQKLLKAQLYQGVREYQLLIQPVEITGPAPDFWPVSACLKDIQAAASELWAGDLKEFIPWLEELVVAAKQQERHTRLRAEVGAFHPRCLNYETRYRFRVETALWKAKHAGARSGEEPRVIERVGRGWCGR